MRDQLSSRSNGLTNWGIKIDLLSFVVTQKYFESDLEQLELFLELPVRIKMQTATL